MPANLELKASYPDQAKGHAVARSLQPEFAAQIGQTDTYFNVADGRLKLREVSGGPSELISYRREEGGEERWSRFEIMPVADPIRLKQTLALSPGIRAIVTKSRTVYIVRKTRIHLDVVESLGEFIEFEIPADHPSGDPQVELKSLIAAFGILPADIFRHSYLDLMLKR